MFSHGRLCPVLRRNAKVKKTLACAAASNSTAGIAGGGQPLQSSLFVGGGVRFGGPGFAVPIGGGVCGGADATGSGEDGDGKATGMLMRERLSLINFRNAASLIRC